MANAGRVLSKAQILDHVWNYDFNGEANVVESYISYLRRKVDTTEPRLLHTIRGVGLHPAAAARDMTATCTPPVRRAAGPRIPLRITLVALLVGLVTLALLATGRRDVGAAEGLPRVEQDDQAARARPTDAAARHAAARGRHRARVPAAVPFGVLRLPRPRNRAAVHVLARPAGPTERDVPD